MTGRGMPMLQRGRCREMMSFLKKHGFNVLH